MTTLRALPCLIAACVLATLAGTLTVTTAAQAASADTATSTKTGKAAKKHSAGAPRIIKNPNQETHAERDRRLARECKGMPNAGACLGYGE
jgi:hypothetical protein